MAFSENLRFADHLTGITATPGTQPPFRRRRLRTTAALTLTASAALMLLLVGCSSKDIEVFDQQPTPTAIAEPAERPTPEPFPSPEPEAVEIPDATPADEDGATSPVESPIVPEAVEAATAEVQAPGQSDVNFAEMQDQMAGTGDAFTTKTQLALPEGFPADAPQLDGARIVETYHEDQYYVLSLEADMRPMAAIAKYGNELRQAGWEYRRFQIDGDVKSLLYEKGDRFTKIEVYDGASNDRALINLLVTAEEE